MKKIIALVLYLLPVASVAQVNALQIQDSRYQASTPESYSQSLQAHFKISDVMGLPGDGYFHTILGLRGWCDNTGGKAHELAFSDNDKIYF